MANENEANKCTCITVWCGGKWNS